MMPRPKLNLRLSQLKNRSSLVLLILATLGLSGCAFKKIIFDRLDWVVMYQIDSYLDLDKNQKLKLKPAVTEAISWLKREKVPGAIATIEKLEEAARRKTYDQTVNSSFTAQIDSIRVDLLKKYEAPAVELLLSLTSEQIDHLAKKMNKSNEEIEDILKEKDLSDYDDVLKRQKKTLVEYYGDLTPAQNDSFFTTMRLTRDKMELRLKERKRVQAFIVETLRSKDKTRITTLIQTFRDHGEVWQDKEYVDYRQVAEKRWEEFLVSFHKSLSDAQWSHLQSKLMETRMDLLRMIGRE
ncbi:MAG: hypothetical protein EOP10_31900 [Proteobacteria bacterium]|nr:MAG: hypothetical protein EOP10_31900 [Pseudomonadota bacterium]